MPPRNRVERMVTLEAILESTNLNQAWKRVVANKGSAGVDGMEVGDLRAHLFEHGPELVQSIKEGGTNPNPCYEYLFRRRKKGNSDHWASRQRLTDGSNKRCNKS